MLNFVQLTFTDEKQYFVFCFFSSFFYYDYFAFCYFIKEQKTNQFSQNLQFNYSNEDVESIRLVLLVHHKDFSHELTYHHSPHRWLTELNIELWNEDLENVSLLDDFNKLQMKLVFHRISFKYFEFHLVSSFTQELLLIMCFRFSKGWT